MDEFIKLLNGAGINYFTTLLLVVVAWFVNRGINSIIAQNDTQMGKLDDHGKKLGHIDTSVQLVQQELRLHALEDQRRFEEVHEHLRADVIATRGERKKERDGS